MYDQGMSSMPRFQLFVRESDLGALNVLARPPGAFTDESERIGLLFAGHAAIAFACSRRPAGTPTASPTTSPRASPGRARSASDVGRRRG
jgi:hypothetical protein